MSTLYDRLGVPPTATISEIRSAFRSKARQLHPDVSGARSPEMAAVNEAWAILSDRARRERYDAQLGAEAVGDGDTLAGEQNDAAGGNSVSTRVGRLMVITVLSLLLLLGVRSGTTRATPARSARSRNPFRPSAAQVVPHRTLTILFVYAFSRSGTAMTG